MAPLTRTTWGWPAPFQVHRWIMRGLGAVVVADVFPEGSPWRRLVAALVVAFSEAGINAAEKFMSPRIKALLEDRDRRAEIPHQTTPEA